MQITLLIDNKPKTFIQPFVAGRILRRTLELQKAYDEMIKKSGDDLKDFDAVKEIDMAADYMVEVFNNQFTTDQLMDGLPSHMVYDTYVKIKNMVTTGLDEALGVDAETEDPCPNE